MTGVLDNPSGHSSPESSEVEVADKNGTHVHFNEQTNYVPKRTIITVSPCRINLHRGCREDYCRQLAVVMEPWGKFSSNRA
jgi:hypothetical protein